MVHLADESDDDDLFGPFSSGHIPRGLVHEVDSDLELDDEDSQPPDEEPPPPPIQLAHTRQLREGLGTNAAAKIASVLHYMNSLGLNLPLFLDLLSWGDQDCITHSKIRYERSALMTSNELPSILSRWHKPPRTQTSTHRRAQGAKYPLERFAFSCVESVIKNELEGIRAVMLCPAEDLSLEELTGIFLEDLILKFSSPGFGGTPKFWSLLARLTQTDEQCLVNTKKVPNLVRNKLDIQVSSCLIILYLPDHPLYHLPDHVFSFASSQPLCEDGDHLSPLARSSCQDDQPSSCFWSHHEPTVVSPCAEDNL